MIEEKIVRTDPTAMIKAPRTTRYVPRRLQVDVAKAILVHAEDTRARLVIVLMLQEGLRRGEIPGLQLGDVDLAARTMIVVGKGGHQRILPITDETMEALEAYLAEHPATSGPLIRSYTKSGAGIQVDVIAKLFRRAARKAGIRAVPHQARHTMAGDMLDNGANLRDVQTALGHANLKTTSVYLGLSALGDLQKSMGGRRYGERLGDWGGDWSVQDCVDRFDAACKLAALRVEREPGAHLVECAVAAGDDPGANCEACADYFVPAVAAEEDGSDLFDRRANHDGGGYVIGGAEGTAEVS